MRHRRPPSRRAVVLAASLAAAPALAACGASSESARRDEVLGGRWGALLGEQGGSRDSLALRFTRTESGEVTASGERWIGRERVAVVGRGRLSGDTLSIRMVDSGGRAVNGPTSFRGRAADGALAGVFSDGPFPSNVTFRREP